MSQIKRGSVPTCDRALELHEKGISYEAIAIRLGIRQKHVGAYLKAGLERRERAILDKLSEGNDA